MFAATVPGIVLMVVVVLVLMGLIAWLLPMGPPVTREIPRDRDDVRA
jgi:hypothetical protein